MTLNGNIPPEVGGGGRFILSRADFSPAYLATYERGLLREKIDEALEALRSCTLCPRNCRVNRWEKFAVCKVARYARVSSFSPHFGEEDVLRDADLAMYRAKAAGRSRHQVFDAAMHADAMAQLELETALRRAVHRSELVLEYQPIVALRVRQIAGFEALVRWQPPHRGLVPPSEFIPMAEETGLIVSLGRWVLREACRQMAEWLRARPGAAGLSVSVNVASRCRRASEWSACAFR